MSKRISVLEHTPAQPAVSGFVETLPAHSNGLRIILVSDQKIYTSYDGDWLEDEPQEGWRCYSVYPGIPIIFKDGEWVEEVIILDSIELPSIELPSVELDPEGHGGEDGKEIELQEGTTHIQWRYVGDTSWIDLIAITDITGEDGTDGQDGDELELQVSGGYIQWKLTQDVSWNNLIALSELEGTDGQDGTDGKEIELQVYGGYIQWRYVSIQEFNWNNLIAISALEGADGKEIELQVDGGYIQWRYVGESWQNLVELSELFLEVRGNKILGRKPGAAGPVEELSPGTDLEIDSNGNLNYTGSGGGGFDNPMDYQYDMLMQGTSVIEKLARTNVQGNHILWQSYFSLGDPQRNMGWVKLNENLSLSGSNLNSSFTFPLASTITNDADLTSASHTNKFVRVDKATAVELTLKTGFAVGSEIIIYQQGEGQVEINPDTGVTINSSETKKTAWQHAVVCLKCIASNSWVLFGEREIA